MLQIFECEDCKAQYEEISQYKGLRKIENVKNVLMKHIKSVEEGTEKAEELLATGIGDVLDPNKEQEDNDCQDEGIHNDPQFLVRDLNFVSEENDRNNN